MKDCCMQCSDIRPRKSRTLEHLLQPFIDSFHNFGQLCLIRIFVENIYLWHDDTILYLASSQLQYFCTFPVRKIHHGEFFVKEFPISGTNAPFIFFFGSSSTSPCQGRRGEFFWKTANITFSFPAWAKHQTFTRINNLARSSLDRGALQVLKDVYVVILCLHGDGDNRFCTFWAVVAIRTRGTSGSGGTGDVFGSTGVRFKRFSLSVMWWERLCKYSWKI